MSKTLFLTRRLAAVPLVLVLAHCQPKSVEDQVAALPELPPEIAATLDPDTLATKVVSGVRPPETTGVLPADGCSTTEERHLKVRFRYTKCGPLDDVVALEELVLTQERRGRAKPETHRLTEFRGTTMPSPHFCRTSDGPWNALLIEQRGCSTQTVRNLMISAFGDAIPFTWVGTASPPANVEVVACRQESFVESTCGMSSCDPPQHCPDGATCPCPLELPTS